MNTLKKIAAETKQEIACCERQLAEAKDNAFEEMRHAIKQVDKGDLFILAAYGACKILGISVPAIIPRVLREVIESQQGEES